MRIAIFSDNFHPEMSGITDSIVSLAKELAKRGHFIYFYVPKYSAKNYAFLKLPAKEIDLGEKIKVTRLFSLPYPTATKQGRMVIPSGFRWFFAKNVKIDVIHTQLFFGAGIEALMAARILGVPLIGTNHTAIKEFLRYSPIRSEWFGNLALKYVNWYYGKCAFTTAPSRSVLDEMKLFGFKGDCRVISNPIDTETFSPAKNRTPLKKKFGLGEFTVIHAGRLGAERSVDVILRAMPLVKKEIPEAKLAIAGKGVAEENLRRLAQTLGIASSVKFLGFLDQPTLAEAYNASDVFAITSTADTQSMVMMQAMASGLPTIGVRARALPEYINPKNGVLIEPGDYAALAKKIIFLFKNPETRKKLAEGATTFAQRFSAPAIAEEWEKIYQEAVKKYNESLEV